MFKKDVEPLLDSLIDASLDPLRVGLGRLHLGGRHVPHEEFDWFVEFIDYQDPWDFPDMESYWFDPVSPEALIEGRLQLPLPTGGDIQFEIEWMHGEDLRINLKPWYGFWDKSAADRIVE